jgi:uncharacterized protein (TIGR03118 family)
VVTGGPARFIFVTEEGTISGWNRGTNAELKVDNSASGAIYKGGALGTDGGSNLLFVANFHAGTIEVFNADFAPLNRTNAFIDPTMPTNFAPFNIQNLNGSLYVAYAKQDEAKEDDVPGAGEGHVNVFDPGGNLRTRLISNGPLNAPWGFALAPTGFSGLGGALLVGNFGDGVLNAFNATNGASLGPLRAPSGAPIIIEGLWGLKFGNGAAGGDPNVLYFTAGPGDEQHGVFGAIAPAGYLKIIALDEGTNSLTLSWLGGIPPYSVQEKASLTNTSWSSVLTTSNRTATVTRDDDAGFFRVIDQTTEGAPAGAARTLGGLRP